jgi:hypothetical protein
MAYFKIHDVILYCFQSYGPYNTAHYKIVDNIVALGGSMKRYLLIVALVVVMALAVAAPAFAGGNDPAPGSTCGEFFGQHHAEHAQMGMLGQDMNPGMHQGLAGFMTDMCP